MTPDLIALLLSLPLPVRLALLDADPNAPGWAVVASVAPSVYLRSECLNVPGMRQLVEHGDAWLPCNPRAIERHAQRLHRKRLIELPPTAFVVDAEGNPTSEPVREEADRRYRYYRMLGALSSPYLDDTSERDYMNAIALLREVVGS